MDESLSNDYFSFAWDKQHIVIIFSARFFFQCTDFSQQLKIWFCTNESESVKIILDFFLPFYFTHFTDSIVQKYNNLYKGVLIDGECWTTQSECSSESSSESSRGNPNCDI